jgi:sensor histidine kinase YesM
LTASDIFIAPLALQMLVENAIKHNVVADDEPLTIRIFAEGGFVCVVNNLQKKKIPLEPSAGVGLENIRRRYELLTDRKVVIDENEKTFAVKLPEIKKAQT